jgi:hypothetical protein
VRLPDAGTVPMPNKEVELKLELAPASLPALKKGSTVAIA